MLTRVIKSTVKGAFHWLGVELHRVDSRRVSTARLAASGLLEQARACGLEVNTVVDVGAAFGDFSSECHSAFPRARYLLVEPLEEYRPQLERTLRSMQRAELATLALGKREGEVTFHVHSDWVGSSMYVESEEPGVNGTPRQVRSTTLDALLAERQLPGPYLLKVDVQGAELDVLEGASMALAQAQYVVLEVSLFRFFAQGPLFDEVVAFMRERDFYAYDIANPHYRPIDGALAQIDVAFVPSKSPLRVRHAYATAEQRAQLNRLMEQAKVRV